jgi:hypothetical protein
MENESLYAVTGQLEFLAMMTKQLIKQYPFVQQAYLTGLSGIRPLLLISQDNCALIVSKYVIQVEVNAPIL